jgi:hypothetical protein
MKLVRNTTPDGTCKYALIRLDKLPSLGEDPQVAQALKLLADKGLLEYGLPHAEDEFFAIKLKDVHAQAALLAYANHAKATQPEFAKEIFALAQRSGPAHKLCGLPD